MAVRRVRREDGAVIVVDADDPDFKDWPDADNEPELKPKRTRRGRK